MTARPAIGRTPRSAIGRTMVSAVDNCPRFAIYPELLGVSQVAMAPSSTFYRARSARRVR